MSKSTIRKSLLRAIRHREKMKGMAEKPDKWVGILSRKLKKRIVSEGVNPSHWRMQLNEIKGLEFYTGILFKDGLTADQAATLESVFKRIESLLVWSISGVKTRTLEALHSEFSDKAVKRELAFLEEKSGFLTRIREFDRTDLSRISLFEKAKQIIEDSPMRVSKINALTFANQQLIDNESNQALDPNRIYANSADYRAFLRYLKGD